ncbi:MAG TPA: hypothetical protein PL048_08980 [Leptospiraceae bacterium]|nr:hypothetical protein [Leptospiraceae bacterium]HMZ58895.1 hypothetical protein [Leptospiraceae bacterium]HNI25597.1 hypothetical protein [Leptospiraceae bacterium]HNN06762.1 hypothetical protein [Leptospiraceae bacterium]HNO23551.1 hypothetical protein [Leptospiraceae bacterium]
MRLLLILLMTGLSLYSEEKKVTASEIMQMQTDSAFEVIGRLNKTETAALITQIRAEAKKEYKDIDKFYLLISHLEKIQSVDEEQKRLKDLNLVYLLALGLFSGFLLYVYFRQRKMIQSLERHIQN